MTEEQCLPELREDSGALFGRYSGCYWYIPLLGRNSGSICTLFGLSEVRTGFGVEVCAKFAKYSPECGCLQIFEDHTKFGRVCTEYVPNNARITAEVCTEFVQYLAGRFPAVFRPKFAQNSELQHGVESCPNIPRTSVKVRAKFGVAKFKSRTQFARNSPEKRLADMSGNHTGTNT